MSQEQNLVTNVLISFRLKPPLSMFKKGGGLNPIIATKTIEHAMTLPFFHLLCRNQVLLNDAGAGLISGTITLHECGNNPPVMTASGCMLEGTMEYVEKLRTNGWELSEEGLKLYGWA